MGAINDLDSISNANSFILRISADDTNAKMRASGWHVMDVYTGDTSVCDIVSALKLAKSIKGKPTFINIRTTIGYGTAAAGTHKTHHSNYSEADAALYAQCPDVATHQLSEDGKEYFAHCRQYGASLQRDWDAQLEHYCRRYPVDGKALRDRMAGKINMEATLRAFQTEKLGATREHDGRLFSELIKSCPSLVGGSCDLWNSGMLGDTSQRIFDEKNPAGQIIRYGIREHAMASISNGLAAYSPAAFIPVTSTFFMFYLYAAAGVRMGALMGLRIVHLALHDSIGEGQNGPTHQPVELDSLYRAMPNMLYIRPSDAEEVVGAWLVASTHDRESTIISLARDKAVTEIPNTSRDKVALGGYVVVETANALVTLVSCGSELEFAVAAAGQLSSDHAIPTRVVSMPCVRLFEAQSEAYQDSVLSNSIHMISVEAYVSTLWARYCTASIAMSSFGFSGAGRENFRRFGLDNDGIVKKVISHVGSKSSKRWKLIQ